MKQYMSPTSADKFQRGITPERIHKGYKSVLCQDKFIS